MEILNHPNPIDTQIAFVFVYENKTISYNQFGQRLGCYLAEEGREQEFYCTFYTNDRVIITLKENRTLFLFHDMTEDSIVHENRTDEYWEDSTLNHADYDARHILYFHFRDYIPSYSQLINGLQPLLQEANLVEKYHHEFFLDFYALLKVLHFSSWRSSLIDTVMERIKKEIISDLYHFPAQSNYQTTNDILWDELTKIPIIRALNMLKEI